MSSIAIIGAPGQLGAEHVAAFTRAGNHTVRGFAHAELDVTNSAQVAQGLTGFAAVINCAAFHRVDECEGRAAEAERVNATGARHVAEACRAMNALCVYISTDYVFDGRQPEPYAESATPHPVNVYGRSMLAGEQNTQSPAGRWIVARLAGLFGKTGARGKGGNFVENILAKARAGEPLRVVNDMRMSPTYARDAAELIVSLVQRNATGIFHVSNAGSCTWHEFATRIVTEAGISAAIQPIPSAPPVAGKARRPANSALTSVRLPQVLGHSARPWPEALRAYLSEAAPRSSGL